MKMAITEVRFLAASVWLLAAYLAGIAGGVW